MKIDWLDMNRAAALVIPFGLMLGALRAPADAREWVASGLSRKTVYHSPQKPGYTSWAGAWVMADGSLMICFTEATGPVKGRGQAPEALWRKLGMADRGWDFTGLDRRQVYLRSTDRGAHWVE